MNQFIAPLGPWDYMIAVVILLIPVAIGIWYAYRDVHKATRDEYLLGGRQMSVIPVSLSLFITPQSGISQLGLPTETFFYGGIYLLSGFGLGLSYIIGCFTIVPLMYPLQITSIYEYLKLRYQSEVVRLFSTVIGMMTMICVMALSLLTPALVLEASADFPLWVSIAVFGAVGTLYTTIGGFKSVVWTDVFQVLVICIGIGVIVAKATTDLGGFEKIYNLAQAGGRINFSKFSLDPTVRHTLWGVIIGHCFMWLIHGFSQPTLQRIVSMRNLDHARITYMIQWPLVAVYAIVFCFLGLIIFAYFENNECDPYEAGLISNRNQLAPFFVLHAMGDMSGISGLYVALLCCGSLSTLSSGLNALAANTVEDILQWPLQRASEGTITFISKLMAAAFGGHVIGLALFASSLEGPIIQMASTAFGALGSPILGIFIMGATVPWANKFGALVGAVVSLSFNLWICAGSALYGSPPKPLPSIGLEGCSRLTGGATVLTDKANNNTTTPGYENDVSFLFRISYEWYALLGTTVCMAVGLAVSALVRMLCGARHTGSKGMCVVNEADSRYIFPCVRWIWGMRHPHSSDSDDSNFDPKGGTAV